VDGTIIDRQIRRCNRNLLLVNAGVVGALLLWVVLEQRYLYNCVAGPFPVAADALQRVGFASGEPDFLAVTDDLQAVDTGVYLSHTSNGVETSKDYYLAGSVGGRLLLIQASSTTPLKRYEGSLTPIPTNIRELIEKDLKKEGAQFDTLFLPLMLDSTSYRANAYYSLAFGLPVFGLCLYNLKKAFYRMEDARNSPIYQAINRYGENTDEIARMVDGEASCTDVKKYGAFTLTPSWLLHKTFFSFTPFHLSDIIWTYPKRTQHYYYFIPTGKSHGVVVADAAGRRAEADFGRGKASEKQIEEFINILRSRIPWVITGYSDEVKNLHQRNLQQLVAAVAESKRAYEQES
jgi:hypothetical protein